jgi:6-phosphofructokinase 1
VQIATDALDRLHTTAASHHRVIVTEVMGRYAGWIALHSGLAGGADIILIPEMPYDLNAVCQCCLDRQRRGRRSSIVCVAEGAKPAGGEMTVRAVVAESHDPVRLGGVANVLADQIERQCGIESRAVILGHVLRGGTPTAFDRVLATQFGWHALEMMMAGRHGELVVYHSGGCGSIPLEMVADRIRTVTPDHPALTAAQRIGVTFGQAV